MAGRVCVYVDGFNLYHSIAALNQPHLKWLDLASLSEKLICDGETLECVKYFSAFATWLPDPYKRHREYVAALESRGVVAVMAHFKDKYRSCKRCGHNWKAHEEKETDVRIALAILEDAVDKYDRAIIVSADSDLVPVIESARDRFVKKSYYVAIPPKQYRYARGISKSAHGYFEIRVAKIESSRLPEQVLDGDGNVVAARPAPYAPPP